MATTIRGSDNWDSALAKSVAIIADVKAYDVDGGTFTQDAWRTRDLNTELDDPSNIVTIASNQFTLQAGTYLIEWFAPVYRVDRHSSRLQNITDGTTDAMSVNAYANDSNTGATNSVGAGIVTLSGAKAFEIQHYASLTKTVNGFGLDTNISGQNSVYTLVKIHLIGV